MDTVGAALIGAGVGATTSIAAQFIAHGLGVRRDRRSQKRHRLYEVVVEVALLLYGPLSDPRRDPPSAEYLAVLGEFPLELANFQDGYARGLTILKVHFGHDHAIIRDYVTAYDPVLQAKMVRCKRDKPDDWLEILTAGTDATNVFVEQARAHVDRI